MNCRRGRIFDQISTSNSSELKIEKKLLTRFRRQFSMNCGSEKNDRLDFDQLSLWKSDRWVWWTEFRRRFYITSGSKYGRYSEVSRTFFDVEIQSKFSQFLRSILGRNIGKSTSKSGQFGLPGGSLLFDQTLLLPSILWVDAKKILMNKIEE